MEGSPANFNEGDDQQTQHLILDKENCVQYVLYDVREHNNFKYMCNC